MEFYISMHNDMHVSIFMVCSPGLFCLFVCNVAIHPKSTSMVMAGWSVDLTTPFPGQA